MIKYFDEGRTKSFEFLSAGVSTDSIVILLSNTLGVGIISPKSPYFISCILSKIVSLVSLADWIPRKSAKSITRQTLPPISAIPWQ